jgi:hypothetical protein
MKINIVNKILICVLVIVIVFSGYLYLALSKQKSSHTFSNGQKVVNVKIDFGAKGNGKSEDTDAFKKAIAYAERTKSPLFIPEGEYLIKDTLTINPTKIYGVGEGRTTLIFANMHGKDGISFTSSKEVGINGEVSNLTIIAQDSHGGSAIKTPKDGSLYSKYHVRYYFHNIEFRGEKRQKTASGFVYDYGWEYYMNVGDSWGTYIERIDAIGTYKITEKPDQQPDQTFLRISASKGILTARINSITTHGIKRAVEIHDRAFFMIDQSDFAHGYEGIVDTGSMSYSEGRITNTLINAQYVGIDLSNRSWLAIDNVSISRHKNGYDHKNNWYGIRLDNVNKSWISNIRSQADVSITKFGGTKYGFYFKNSDGLSARGLIPGFGLDYSIVNDQTKGATFDGTNFIGSGGTAWRFINNSRNISIGTFTVNSAIKTIYSSDHTIDKSTIKEVSTNSIE